VNDRNPYGSPQQRTQGSSRFELAHAAVILLISILLGAIAFTVTANMVSAYRVTFPFLLATIPGVVAGAVFSPLTYVFLQHRPLQPAAWTLIGVVTTAGAITALFNPWLSLVVMLVAFVATGLLIHAFFPNRPVPRDPTRCATCDYSLTGLTTNMCPECGKHIDNCSAERERPS
jgi:hypothetical protein